MRSEPVPEWVRPVQGERDQRRRARRRQRDLVLRERRPAGFSIEIDLAAIQSF